MLCGMTMVMGGDLVVVTERAGNQRHVELMSHDYTTKATTHHGWSGEWTDLSITRGEDAIAVYWCGWIESDPYSDEHGGTILYTFTPTLDNAQMSIKPNYCFSHVARIQGKLIGIRHVDQDPIYRTTLVCELDTSTSCESVFTYLPQHAFVIATTHNDHTYAVLYSHEMKTKLVLIEIFGSQHEVIWSTINFGFDTVKMVDLIFLTPTTILTMSYGKPYYVNGVFLTEIDIHADMKVMAQVVPILDDGVAWGLHYGKDDTICFFTTHEPTADTVVCLDRQLQDVTTKSVPFHTHAITQ